MRRIPLLLLVTCLSPGLQAQEPVFDLEDRACRDDVLLSVIEDAFVYASCEPTGRERIMRLSVVNKAVAAVGPLREFSIGFCGPSVLGAFAESGWVARVEGAERHSVTFELSDDEVDRLGLLSGARARGFVVRLKPGWKRSRSDGARWGEATIVATATTHDC